MALTATLTRKYPNTWPRAVETADSPSVGSLRLRANGSVSYTEGTLKITPVIEREDGDVFGAEVSGVDWDQPISPEITQQVCTYSHCRRGEIWLTPRS